MSVALITGASRGLGRALARALAAEDWELIIDGRDSAALATAATDLPRGVPAGARAVDLTDVAGVVPAGARAVDLTDSTRVVRAVAMAGDVTDPGHRQALLDAVAARGRLDLLVNNASLLGPSPQPDLAQYPLEVLRQVYEVNTLAPLALAQGALPWLRRSGGRLVNITSDAAVEAYPGWGGYGSSKAALEQLTRVLIEECPDLRIYLADPGDLRTQMHQEAFPGQDISDRPLPEVAVPGLLALARGEIPSGRYRLQDYPDWSASNPGPSPAGQLAGVVDLTAQRQWQGTTVA